MHFETLMFAATLKIVQHAEQMSMFSKCVKKDQLNDKNITI
jgi:hypothetical protein